MMDLTPVEFHEGMWFKREDKYAPMGYGNINGSKLRQCVYLIDKWHKEGGLQGVASGSVSQSPQHAFIATVCAHYGVRSYIVSGAQKPYEHKYLRMALEQGAQVTSSRVGYAQACGAQARKATERWEGFRYLETNITLDHRKHPGEDLYGFHAVGANQVRNLPADVETLIIPCGSCNSVTSIFLGLILYPLVTLKRIVLLGIGNMGSKDILYVRTRLRALLKGAGGDDLFDWDFGLGDGGAAHQLEYHNLNGEGFCTYQMEMHERIAGITFHPRYEGKCIRYLKEFLPEHLNPKTCFWIVGSDIR